MRRTILAILAVLLIAPSIRAADPAPPAGAAQHPTRILVLPFSMTGAEGKYAWIGQAIAENFQAELAKAGFATVNPANADGPIAIGDPDKALRVAQNSRAEVVIFGSYQFLDPDLRVTGQIVDVGSNQIVGVLKASGTFRQLFTIEDDLSDQSKKLLISDKEALGFHEERGIGSFVFNSGCCSMLSICFINDSDPQKCHNKPEVIGNLNSFDVMHAHCCF